MGSRAELTIPLGIVVDSKLTLVHEAKVEFDADLSHYGIKKGVLSNPAEGEIFAPVAMWLEAVDLVLERLQQQGLMFGDIQGISGAGMQHGTVFWSGEAERLMAGLDAKKLLKEQLKDAVSHEYSPNWQDASTQKQCEEFDACLGNPERLAEVTGSKAHHVSRVSCAPETQDEGLIIIKRFSGPQILRFRSKYPDAYQKTARISLVSSFLASVFLGKVAPLDIGDVCGMNLWDIKSGSWNQELISLAAGGSDGASTLSAKLGAVPEDGGGSFGTISPYFVLRYGFPLSCSVVPFTGDNPSTILALPLRASDAIVSLGTSTTFLMSTPEYKPDPSYHFFNHPTTKELYMFMLCYKNGGLAREQIRDALNDDQNGSWDKFNDAATSTPPMGVEGLEKLKMGLYFPRPEIVPNVTAGTWRYRYTPASDTLTKTSKDSADWSYPTADARAIIESQMLSLRLRSQNLVMPQTDGKDSSKKLPPQPRRIYLVGGGSLNPAIAQVCGEVLGSAEGVYRLDIGGNACALGAAYKAVWGCERADGETFEELIGKRWHEEGFVQRVAGGYTEGVWEKYGDALKGFDEMEKRVLATAGSGQN